MMAKWIEFKEINSAGKKTKMYTVVSKDTKDVLGIVKWYAPWRKYSFFPYSSTVFEWDCLRDISDFIQKETKEYKKYWYKS